MKQLIILLLTLSMITPQSRTPAVYWESLEMSEKIAFINGVYATGAKLKFHHKQEVK